MTERDKLIESFKGGNLSCCLQGNAEWDIVDEKYNLYLDEKTLQRLSEILADIIIEDRNRIIEKIMNLYSSEQWEGLETLRSLI